MIKQTLIMWLFKVIEIIFVAILGYLITLLIQLIVPKSTAVCGVAVFFYFFSETVKPYIDELRDWIFEKIA